MPEDARATRNVRYDFSGEVVVVTGGARGQGRSHALAFAGAGATVVITDVGRRVETIQYAVATSEELEATARDVEALGVRCLAETCDVRDPDEVARLYERIDRELGRLDVLINNAGIDRAIPFQELDVAAWDDMMATHLRGAFLMSQGAVPLMDRQGRGKIIMTGSMASLVGLPNRSHYVTAKHGLLGLTRALALDLGPHRINVNMVCPGAIRSPMNAAGAARPELRGVMRDLMGSFNVLESDPERVLLGPEEITAAMLWLASDASDFVTGATIVVDAGASIK